MMGVEPGEGRQRVKHNESRELFPTRDIFARKGEGGKKARKSAAKLLKLAKP